MTPTLPEVVRIVKKVYPIDEYVELYHAYFSDDSKQSFLVHRDDPARLSERIAELRDRPNRGINEDKYLSALIKVQEILA